MTMLTPSTFMTIEEIVLLLGSVAGGAWLVRRRAAGRLTEPASAAALTASPSKYHPLLVAIHWFTAFALANLLLRGALIMRYIPNSDPAKLDGLRAHMLAGLLVFTVMAIRIVLRRRTQLPAPATARNPHLDRLARISHLSLYILVIAQASSGIFMAVQTDLPQILLLGQGGLPADFWMFPIRSVHYAVSRLLIAVICLHLAGASYHALFLKDGLLRRMTFGRRWTPAAMRVPAGRGRVAPFVGPANASRPSG